MTVADEERTAELAAAMTGPEEDRAGGVRRRLGPWIGLPVLAVLLGFIAVLATRDIGGPDAVYSSLIGRPAPKISGTTIDGDRFDLAELRGTPVVVNFFANWCVPCIREHPELVNFSRRHAIAGDAQVVSVVYDSRREKVQAFFDDNGGEWPVIEDPDGLVALNYGVSGVPESYLVDADGIVVAKIVGGVTASELDRLLAQLQAGP